MVVNEYFLHAYADGIRNELPKLGSVHTRLKHFAAGLEAGDKPEAAKMIREYMQELSDIADVIGKATDELKGMCSVA